MKVHPTKTHYCEHCDENQPGSIKEVRTENGDHAEVFQIGCCFDLEWVGTRDQAEGLFDYLSNAGYLQPAYEAACGCVGGADAIYNEDDGWQCGACNEVYSYKEDAIECCADSEEEEPEPENVVTINTTTTSTGYIYVNNQPLVVPGTNTYVRIDAA